MSIALPLVPETPWSENGPEDLDFSERKSAGAVVTECEHAIRQLGNSIKRNRPETQRSMMNDSAMTSTSPSGPSVAVTWPEYDSIHNPHEYFAVCGWHAITASGAWDLDRMIQELPLSFSDSLVNARKIDETKFWNLGFQLPDKTILSLHRRSAADSILRVWAPSLEQARGQLSALQAQYLCRSKRKAQPTTIIVLSARPDLETRAVPVKVPVRTAKQVELNYGTDFARWSDSFLSALRSNDAGLSIFSGQAGTGKTTFARYIAHKLRHSHRFYFIPVDLFSTVTGPRAMDFWLAQNAIHEKSKKVLLIEDAETLLMHRAQTDAIFRRAQSRGRILG